MNRFKIHCNHLYFIYPGYMRKKSLTPDEAINTRKIKKRETKQVMVTQISEKWTSDT